MSYESDGNITFDGFMEYVKPSLTVPLNVEERVRIVMNYRPEIEDAIKLATIMSQTVERNIERLEIGGVKYDRVGNTVDPFKKSKVEQMLIKSSYLYSIAEYGKALLKEYDNAIELLPEDEKCIMTGTDSLSIRTRQRKLRVIVRNIAPIMTHLL